MRVPLSWLAEFVDFDLTPEEVSEGLTRLGLKVEALHRLGAGLDKVMVGEVLAIEPHPNADNLILVEVSTGKEQRRIVCGARNFSVGSRVPVVVPGGVLPEGKVERATIRGEASDGMLCSARELGLGEDHSGIYVLPPEAPVGADVREVLGLDDVVLELEITPNRPDAMSLVGVAREVALLTGSEVRVPAGGAAEGGDPVSDFAEVEVSDPSGCPRYLARVVTGVGAGASPDWVARRLIAAGVRPISGVVDATNYALLVTGHPMHAFDLDTIGGARIVVRRAEDRELLLTLDGQERELAPADLVIADAGRAIALAGVMGGAETEVGPGTTRILVESAYFDPVSVLDTSKRHGLRTEASARFERGADPEAVSWAADYACGLIVEWAGGDLAPATIDVYPEPMERARLWARPERVNLVLGTEIEPGEMTQMLERLGMSAEIREGKIRAEVPTRRPDIQAEEDLIEEIARMFGYEKIPSRLPAGSNRVGGLTREQSMIREIRRVLVGAGASEAYTSSLIGPDDLERMAYTEDHPARGAIPIANALTRDESLLRPSLIPGLVASAARNAARRNLTARLFEIGRIFGRSDELLPTERLHLGIALGGPVPQEWHTPGGLLDFYDLKGILEVLLASLRLEGEFIAEPAASLHPGRSATLSVAGNRLGFLGELAEDVTANYELPHRVQVAELDLDMLLSLAEAPEAGREVPRFPAVHLDLAISVPEEVPVAAVVATAKEAGGPHLEEVRLFDVYRGEQAGEGRTSVAIALTFRSGDRTLTDEETLAARDAIAAAVTERHGGEIRGS